MNRIIVDTTSSPYTINRHVYGHFAEHLGRCIYDGIYVGEDSPIPNTRGMRNDIVEALRRIKIPNLRWPGGCFADDYHWKDGVGPQAARPRTINMWGNVIEDHQMGTHEFLDLCDQLGCDPYICGNVGSGTVREMQEWVEYLTFDGHSTMADWRRQNGREEPWRIPFWGIGNENWGCGGHMPPEYYADLYTRHYTFLRQYGAEPMMKIASGYGGTDTTGEGLAAFLKRLSRHARPRMIQAVSLHYYVFLPERKEHSGTEFGEREWFEVLKMAGEIEGAIASHVAVLDEFDPDKRVWLIVDEWGAWYPSEPGTILYQQNTMRDALVAALTLHIFQAHGDRVQMANLAQLVNVLQTPFLTEGEKMILTPTYHVLDMFKVHQDAAFLPVDVQSDPYTVDGQSIPAVSASASRDQAGDIHLTLCNLDPHTDLDVACELRGVSGTRISGQILTAPAMNAHNTFDQPDAVHPVAFDGARLSGDQLQIRLPAKSVVALAIG